METENMITFSVPILIVFMNTPSFLNVFSKKNRKILSVFEIF